MEEKIYLTEEGLERLKNKLEKLKNSLPALIEETQRTAAYGDRSDNAEYKDAKFRLRRTQGQIIGIENQLKYAEIIMPGDNLSVKIGSTVVLEINGGEKKTYRILGSLETDPSAGKISYKSPLGEALLGLREGNFIEITTVSGSKKYKILEIE